MIHEKLWLCGIFVESLTAQSSKIGPRLVGRIEVAGNSGRITRVASRRITKSTFEIKCRLFLLAKTLTLKYLHYLKDL